MECDPTLSDDVVQLAWPLLRLRLLQLVMPVSPSLKVTFPDGVPVPGLFAVTVAANFTDCPNTAWLNEALTAVAGPPRNDVLRGDVEAPTRFVATPPVSAAL